MLFRNVFDFIFASPVMVVSSIVSVACAGILAVSLTSKPHTLSSDVVNNVSGSGGVDTDVILPQDDSNAVNSSYVNERNGASGRESNRTSGNSSEQYYGVSTVRDNSFSTINNSSSVYNFPSSVDSLGGLTSSATSNSAATSKNGTSASANDSVKASETGGKVNTRILESNFPASLEHTVKIDLDETQIISCRPIVSNGPPCMCTFTTSDASGSVSEVVDNCS